MRRIRERLSLAIPSSPPPPAPAPTPQPPASSKSVVVANTSTVCTVDPLAPARSVDEAGALARLRALREATPRAPKPKDDPNAPKATRLNVVLKAICRFLLECKGKIIALQFCYSTNLFKGYA